MRSISFTAASCCSGAAATVGGAQAFTGAVSALGRTTETVLGGMLVFVAIGLFWRLRVAWALAVLLAALTVGVNVAQHEWRTALVLSAVIFVALMPER